MTHSSPILQADSLNFSYPVHPIFSNFSVSIPLGITVIRGGDGRGKSTLLRLLAGVLPAQKGQLHIEGVDLYVQPANYKAQVFWAEPRSDAFDQLTVLDYFQLQRSSWPNFDDAVRADMTEGLGLQEHLHKQLFMLSTGTKRKVFLAAAFASNTRVTLLDEPFAALDAASIDFVLTRLQDAQDPMCRAWVIADYAAPQNLHVSQIIELGD